MWLVFRNSAHYISLIGNEISPRGLSQSPVNFSPVRVTRFFFLTFLLFAFCQSATHRPSHIPSPGLFSASLLLYFIFLRQKTQWCLLCGRLALRVTLKMFTSL
jgi:hypothetical protein